MSSASKNITQKLLPAFKVNLLEYTFFPEKSQDDSVVMEILPEMKKKINLLGIYIFKILWPSKCPCNKKTVFFYHHSWHYLDQIFRS